MYGNEALIPAATRDDSTLPWWGFAAPTAFAILATSHLAQVEPHGPMMVVALLMFLMTQVGEIVSQDRTARPARYLMRVVLWVLAGPLMVALLSPDGLYSVRRTLALAFLGVQALSHLVHVYRYGPAVVRDALGAFTVDALIVWIYCDRVLTSLSLEP